MKSWRFTGTNEPLQLAELPEPTAGPGQVVVDVKAAGICHTDVGILTDPGWMTMLAQVPVTLGHEDAGVISQVGEGVDDFQVGDRVAICPTTPAGCPGPPSTADSARRSWWARRRWCAFPTRWISSTAPRPPMRA